MIKYELAQDISGKISEIANKLSLEHVQLENVVCVRSIGSGSRNTIARCHALPRIWQKSLNRKAAYIIEVISEKFDKLNEKEKIETLIHELLHIPKSFGGGFIHHSQMGHLKKVCERYFSS